MPDSEFVRDVDARLAALGDPTRAEGARAYMKSDLRFHGVTAAQIDRVARDLGALRPWDRPTLIAAVRALYATPDFDLHSVAVELLRRRVRVLTAEDAALVEELVRASACWAHVDELATHVAGPLLKRFPSMDADLRRWAGDPDFWVVRLALLADLPELRAGRGDFARFEELAVPVFGSREFFLRKAVGWVLRDTSRKRPTEVADFVRRHGAAMSGLTRREAIRNLPAELRATLL